jgi:SAM-dependent methyltransferase
MTSEPFESMSTLFRHPDGYWVGDGPSLAVSYPSEDNDTLFDIEDGSFWFSHRNEVIRTLMSRYPPAGPFFDIGAGNGFVAKSLEDAGLQVWVVEPGPAGARNAVRRGLTRVICAPFEHAGLSPASFPSAGLFDVIEHIEDDVGFLQRLRRYMVPGGRLYVTVPAYQALWSDEDARGGHYRRYSRRQLLGVLRKAGFEPEFASYFFWCLPLPILLLRALPHRFGLHASGTPEAVRRSHGVGGARVRLAASVLAVERWPLARGIAVPFGGSCITVARAQL